MVLGVSFYFPVFFVIALCVCVGVIAWYFVFRKRQQEIDNAPVTQPTAADGHGATNPNTHNNEMYNYNNDPSNHGGAYGQQQHHGDYPHPQQDGGIYGNPQQQHQQQPYYPPPPAHQPAPHQHQGNTAS